MRAGLGLLRIAPRDFWAMTPRELAAALDGLMGRGGMAKPLGRQGLADLMRRYPDRTEDNTDV